MFILPWLLHAFSRLDIGDFVFKDSSIKSVETAHVVLQNVPDGAVVNVEEYRAST